MKRENPRTEFHSSFKHNFDSSSMIFAAFEIMNLYYQEQRETTKAIKSSFWKRSIKVSHYDLQ